jgi:S1-C subfamily serine protease
VLRVLGATATPLRSSEPTPGAPVAILGYPDNGPLTAIPGRVGTTATTLTRDAYGHGPVERTITAVAGRVRHGNSGGPAVDARGVVRATIFAARVGSPTGYGIPSPIVAQDLRSAQRPVSTGSCAS